MTPAATTSTLTTAKSQIFPYRLVGGAVQHVGQDRASGGGVCCCASMGEGRPRNAAAGGVYVDTSSYSFPPPQPRVGVPSSSCAGESSGVETKLR
jgi:hypothetical protein